jgi:hypothetical protein
MMGSGPMPAHPMPPQGDLPRDHRFVDELPKPRPTGPVTKRPLSKRERDERAERIKRQHVEAARANAPRRCDTNEIGASGECLACDADQGEHCRRQSAPAAAVATRDPQHDPEAQVLQGLGK